MLMHLKSKLLLSVVESHKRFTRYKGIGAVPYLRSRHYTLHEIAHGHLIRAFPVWVMWPMRMHSRGHIHELKNKPGLHNTIGEQMAKKYFSEQNLKFLLYEVFDAKSLTAHEYYGDHNKKTFDLVLNFAGKIAKDLLWPIFEEMDRNPPELENGTIKVHPNVKKIMREFGQGGWISTIVPYELDGEQLPHLIACACSFIFMAANYSASVYTMLCDCSAGSSKTSAARTFTIATYQTCVPASGREPWL